MQSLASRDTIATERDLETCCLKTMERTLDAYLKKKKKRFHLRNSLLPQFFIRWMEEVFFLFFLDIIIGVDSLVLRAERWFCLLNKKSCKSCTCRWWYFFYLRFLLVKVWLAGCFENLLFHECPLYILH